MIRMALLAAALLGATLPLPAQTVRIELTVRRPNGSVVQLSAADLSQLRRVSGRAVSHGDTLSYEGIDLRQVLLAAGAPVDSLRGAQLRRVLLIVGADGYAAAVALADLDPGIAGRRAFLVDREDGAALPPDRGPWRVIIEGDLRPARWVRQVVSLEIIDVQPQSRSSR